MLRAKNTNDRNAYRRVSYTRLWNQEKKTNKENFISFLLHSQVQPGQSKTIAYKQVSYQYNKDGKPGEKRFAHALYYIQRASTRARTSSPVSRRRIVYGCFIYRGYIAKRIP